MPRLKTPQQFYGLHLALFDELQKHIERRGYDFCLPSNPARRPLHSAAMPGARVPLNRDEILTLIRVAAHPDYLASYRLFAKTVKDFGVLFAKWPDEVLDILCFIRAKLADWSNSQAGLVTKFLRTHSFIVNNKGKNIAVANMTDKDIARHLTRPDLSVSPDSVKRARQRIAREDDEKFFFTEHPQVQEFMRGTGGMIRKGKNAGQPNAKLKRLLRLHAKGKKQPARISFHAIDKLPAAGHHCPHENVITDMRDEILRYTDLAAAIQLAKSGGMTTREIVRELSRGMTHMDAFKLAKKAAPLLDIGTAQFMRLRKNQ
jgi:hypothetical protein